MATDISACVWVVIVNFRTPELVIDCLRSLSLQADVVNHGHVVVVDNDSGDGSVEKLRAAIDRWNWAAWAEIMPKERNGGFAFGNNAGINAALQSNRRVDYVMFLNPDTIVRAGAIRALVDFMNTHQRVGITGSALENTEHTLELSAHHAPSPLGELVSGAQLTILSRALTRYDVSPAIRKTAHECDWVSGASLLVRRALFEEIGLLDEGFFLYFEEVDFCSRARKAGWQIWYVPESRIVHFEGASTGIQNIAQRRSRYWYDSRRRYFVKYYGLHGLILADALWLVGRTALALRRNLLLGAGGEDRDPKGFAIDLLWGDLRFFLRRLPSGLVQRMKRLRSLIGITFRSTIYWSGIGRLFEIATQPTGAIILMYHSIAPKNVAEFVDPQNRLSPDVFDAQMAYLSKYRRVISLSQVIEQIASGVSPPAGTVCISFDDGYLDNLTTAAPILEKYHLPATLFLATGYVERSEEQWSDRLYWMIQRRTANRLQIPYFGDNEVDLTSESARKVILELLHRHLLEATYPERKQVLDEIQRQLMPYGHAPRLTLNWDDVRELRRRYPFFEIGGHTREHTDLQKHRNETARSEIYGCAEDLRRELGVPPRHFSFPYGRWCDETKQIVRASGWQSAVGVNLNVRVDKTSDRFAIPRVEAPQTMTDLRFKTSGAYPSLFSALGLR